MNEDTLILTKGILSNSKRNALASYNTTIVAIDTSTTTTASSPEIVTSQDHDKQGELSSSKMGFLPSEGEDVSYA